MVLWQGLIERLPLEKLPDVDLAMNPTDEPRVFVPWETRQAYLSRGAAPSQLESTSEYINEYMTMPVLQAESDSPANIFVFEEFADDMPIWQVARETCDPDSPGRACLARFKGLVAH